MKAKNTSPLFYKYLDVEGARLTLKNRTFKHAKPSDFNDTEDMTVQSIFPEALEMATVTIRDNFLNILEVNRHKTPTCESPMKESIQYLQAWIPEDFNNLKNELGNDDINSIYDVGRLSECCLEFIAWINQWLQNYRVLCVCAIKDSERMWDDYAEKHEGVVLRIQPDLKNDSKFQNLKKIRYCSTRPPFYDDALSFLEGSLFGDQELILSETIEKIIYTKTLKWEHEQEYRLAIALREKEADWNVLPYHPSEITELYLGIKTPDDVKEELVRLAKEINPNIKIFQTKKGGNGLIFNPV